MHRDGVARVDAACACVVRRELDLADRPHERELRCALDGCAGEERPVRDELESFTLQQRLARRGGQRLRRLHTRREGGLVGQVGVGGAAVTARRELVEDRRGIRRELDAEALGELGGPRELVGNRRDHGTALPLQPSFEVDGRAVALEVARTGQDEIAPAAERVLEHADSNHCVRGLCETPDARVARDAAPRRAARRRPLRSRRLRRRGRSGSAGGRRPPPHRDRARTTHTGRRRR